MSAGPARGSVHDRAGVVPVEDPRDAAHAEPATDAEGQVPDQGVVEVVGQSFEEGVVAGGDVALEAFRVLDGDPLGVRVARPGRPVDDIGIVLLAEPCLRSRRIPVAQSEAAAVELGDPHAGQLPDPERHVALAVGRQPEGGPGGDDLVGAHAATLVAGASPALADCDWCPRQDSNLRPAE